MPDSWPDYPHHSQVLAYLERYADHFGLRDHIWFGTEVTKVEPAEDGRWDVTISGARGGGSDRTQRYAAVVVANGHNWSPKLPAYEGLADFKGEVIHASAYKDAAQLRGRRVLVVGAGNTGCDIAVEAAQQATRCWHSSRRGYWYAPKFVYGRPGGPGQRHRARRCGCRCGCASGSSTGRCSGRSATSPGSACRSPTTRSTRRIRSPTASSSTTSGTAPSRRCRMSPGSRGTAWSSSMAARSSPTWSSSPPATCPASSSSPQICSMWTARVGRACYCTRSRRRIRRWRWPACSSRTRRSSRWCTGRP